MAIQDPKDHPKDQPKKGKRIKVAFIDGNPLKYAKQLGDKVFTDGELQIRFEAFCNSYKREIIDWHATQQSHSGNWFIIVRYIE